MQAKDSLPTVPQTVLAQPVAELPVVDVEAAQRHYRDCLGFEICWLYPGGEIGSVKRGETTIFFRRRIDLFEPAVHWVYAVNLLASYEEMKARGANITDPLEKKPWGITQFTVEDVDGNRFYFHGD